MTIIMKFLINFIQKPCFQTIINKKTTKKTNNYFYFIQKQKNALTVLNKTNTLYLIDYKNLRIVYYLEIIEPIWKQYL